MRYEPVDEGMQLIQEPPWTLTAGVAYNIGTRRRILGCVLLDLMGLGPDARDQNPS